MTTHQFLHDLEPKQILRQTERQTLNCQMATLLTKVRLEKEDLSNKKEIMKIEAFVQKLSINKH